MIGNYFGGTLSVGVGPLHTLDCNNGNNGVYEVLADFSIGRHIGARDKEEVDAAKTAAVAAECEEYWMLIEQVHGGYTYKLKKPPKGGA